MVRPHAGAVPARPEDHPPTRGVLRPREAAVQADRGAIGTVLHFGVVGLLTPVSAPPYPPILGDSSSTRLAEVGSKSADSAACRGEWAFKRDQLGPRPHSPFRTWYNIQCK